MHWIHDRQSFLYDLQLALHTQSIGHKIEFESDGPDEAQYPGRVMIGANLTEEPIRRADWFGRNHIVQSGARIVALMFQKLAHQRRLAMITVPKWQRCLPRTNSAVTGSLNWDAIARLTALPTQRCPPRGCTSLGLPRPV